MSVNPIFVKGPRIVLRTTELKDAPGFAALFLNEENWPYDKQPPKENLTIEKREHRVHKETAEREEGKSAFCTIDLPTLKDGARMKPHGIMIGCGGFNSIFMEDGRKVVDTGVMIDSSEWRKGYATEALLISYQYAFETLGADIVQMETLQINRPLRNLAKKILGLNGIERDGEHGPEVLLRMTNEEWLQRSIGNYSGNMMVAGSDERGIRGV